MWNNSMLWSAPPAQDDATAGNPIPKQPGRVLQSYARLIATAYKDFVVFMATPQECTLRTN